MFQGHYPVVYSLAQRVALPSHPDAGPRDLSTGTCNYVHHSLYTINNKYMKNCKHSAVFIIIIVYYYCCCLLLCH